MQGNKGVSVTFYTPKVVVIIISFNLLTIYPKFSLKHTPINPFHLMQLSLGSILDSKHWTANWCQIWENWCIFVTTCPFIFWKYILCERVVYFFLFPCQLEVSRNPVIFWMPLLQVMPFISFVNYCQPIIFWCFQSCSESHQRSFAQSILFYLLKNNYFL